MCSFDPDLLSTLQVMVEEMYEAESAKLERTRLAVAAKTQDIHLLRRKIDDVPTRAELVQYERRFVELYEQVHLNPKHQTLNPT